MKTVRVTAITAQGSAVEHDLPQTYTLLDHVRDLIGCEAVEALKPRSPIVMIVDEEALLRDPLPPRNLVASTIMGYAVYGNVVLLREEDYRLAVDDQQAVTITLNLDGQVISRSASINEMKKFPSGHRAFLNLLWTVLCDKAETIIMSEEEVK